MSEKVTKKPVDENNEAATEKKPAKKPAAKKDEQKPGLFKRVGNWFKSNWKYIAAASGGAVGGAAATYGVGKLGEHIANKRASRNETMNTDE